MRFAKLAPLQKSVCEKCHNAVHKVSRLSFNVIDSSFFQLVTFAQLI